MDVKANEVGVKREIAKLHLNSLYGKFATNTDVTGKHPVMVDNRVVYRRGEEKRRNPVYTPVGVFITSWARDLTIRAAQANYDTFAYADTDSLHLLRDDVPATIDVHPTRLGAWKHEYDYDEALYIRAKAYLERTSALQCKDRKPHTCDASCYYVTRIAGLPTDVSSTLTFDDIRQGKVIHGKLTPVSVPGGIVLTDTPYKIEL